MNLKKFVRQPLVLVLGISFLIRLLYLLIDYPLWWDSHIYISMGKYMFSGGKLGLWESFRPLLHPFLLGLAWKLNLDPFILGKIMDLLFSLLSIYLVYRIGEKIFNLRIAFWAALLFSLTPIFLMHTGLILADPLSLCLGLAGIYLILGNQNSSHTKLALSGFLLSLAFLTRFPLGVWFGSVFLVLLIQKEKLLPKLKKLLPFSLGFGVPFLLNLWLNYYLYADPLQPFVTGSWIVTTATWLYGSGITFYFTNFFLRNPFYLLFFIGLYFYIKNRGWENKDRTILTIIAVLTIAYFIYVPRKEIRYMLAALPFLALFSSSAFITLINRLNLSKKPFVRPKSFLTLGIILLLVPVPTTFSIQKAPTFEKEILSAIDKYNITGMVLSSDPSFVSFLDNPIVTLDDMDFAPIIYQQQKGKYQLLFVSDCNFHCPPDSSECSSQREELLNSFAQENQMIFQKQAIFHTKEKCTYTMYLPRSLPKK